LCWLLCFEEYGATFEKLPGDKSAEGFADTLSSLDIDSLSISQQKQQQEEKELTLLSGSENSSIITIWFPMHTSLIFKEQAKLK
jgi:hypothetical protein